MSTTVYAGAARPASATPPAPQRPGAPWRDLALGAAVAAWIAAGLALDATAGLPTQRGIGVATWLLLFALLRGERAAERWQVAAAVAIATAGEYVLTAALHLYEYRLANVPAFVPPGHGLVYLAALALARSPPAVRHGRALVGLSVSLGAAWALWGVGGAPRPDALGLLLFLVFAAFALVGRAPRVYAAAFVLTTYLELVGTAVGNWTWAARGVGGLLSVGNPPSGVPGVYCVLDALALTTGPAAWRAWERWRAWRRWRVTSPIASSARAAR